MNSPLSSSICLLSSRLILTCLHFAPQEALQRELVLKQKMVILQDLLSTLIQASDSTWKVRETFVGTDISGFYICPSCSSFRTIAARERAFSLWKRRKVGLDIQHITADTWESLAKSRVIS